MFNCSWKWLRNTILNLSKRICQQNFSPLAQYIGIIQYLLIKCFNPYADSNDNCAPNQFLLVASQEKMFKLYLYNLKSLLLLLSLSRRPEGYNDCLVCLNSVFYIQLPLPNAEQAKSLIALSLMLRIRKYKSLKIILSFNMDQRWIPNNNNFLNIIYLPSLLGIFLLGIKWLSLNL